MKWNPFFFKLWAALGLGIFAGIALATEEEIMKTAFIHNFTKFIKWPDEQKSTLHLCVMGNDLRGRSIDSLIGKQVRNMQISVRHAVLLQEIPQCDLVFVPAAYMQSLERVRQVVNNYPVLVVTESSETLPVGAMLALIRGDNRIVFEIDLNDSRRLGFQVSAKILQLARKVY